MSEPISVLKIIKEVEKNVGKPAIIKYVSDRTSQFIQGSIYNSRLRELGWKPKYTFETGMSELYESYKKKW